MGSDGSLPWVERGVISDDALDLLDAHRLLEALGRRYEVWAFVAATDKVRAVPIVSMRTSHNGDRLRVIGLCHYLAAILCHELEADVVVSEDDPLF